QRSGLQRSRGNSPTASTPWIRSSQKADGLLAPAGNRQPIPMRAMGSLAVISVNLLYARRRLSTGCNTSLYFRARSGAAQIVRRAATESFYLPGWGICRKVRSSIAPDDSTACCCEHLCLTQVVNYP